MDFKEILYEKKENYAIITFNIPQKLNPLTDNMKDELAAALDDVEADGAMRGVILTGAGRAFMAGTDLSEIKEDRTYDDAKAMSVKGQKLMNKIERLKKPVIAAVNGYALGGGTELALACDLRVAASNAVFGVPEVDLGVAPCYGGTQRLVRLVGAGRALDLLLTARQVPAQEALDLGIANRVVPKEDLMFEAERLMKKIAKNGPLALDVCKRLVYEGRDMSFEDGLALEADLNGMLGASEDAREGVKSFFEKRKPVFVGR